jgi:D-alanyl-D-alanine carboxypeptidase
MRRATTALALTVVSLAALLGSPASGAEETAAGSAGTSSFPPRAERALDEIVKTGMAASDTPGMAAGVWIPGRGRYVKAFGVADTTTGRPFRLSDHVRIASITKSLTATAVLQLVDRGRLRLGDTLSSYVRGIPNGSTITVRQLLNMTAGVYDYTMDEAFGRAFDRDPLMAFGPRDAVRIVKRHEPSFAPGEGVSYSDSNYVLLGLVVQRVTDRPLGQVIRHRILKPLGMSHTSYPTGPAMPDPHARGYVEAPDGSLRDVTRVNPGVASGAGAMISTLGDLRIWARALAKGTLLSRETHRKQLRTVPFPGQVLDVGYGLGVLDINDFIGHNGAIYGYGSAMFYLPRANATIVVEGNLSSNFSGIPTSVFYGIANYLFPRQFETAEADHRRGAAAPAQLLTPR